MTQACCVKQKPQCKKLLESCSRYNDPSLKIGARCRIRQRLTTEALTKSRLSLVSAASEAMVLHVSCRFTARALFCQPAVLKMWGDCCPPLRTAAVVSPANRWIAIFIGQDLPPPFSFRLWRGLERKQWRWSIYAKENNKEDRILVHKNTPLSNYLLQNSLITSLE